MSSPVGHPRGHFPQTIRAAPNQTYQLNRFLNEPADYKSLVLPTEIGNGHRRAEPMVALEKQIQAIDLIIHDKKRSKVIFGLSMH